MPLRNREPCRFRTVENDRRVLPTARLREQAREKYARPAMMQTATINPQIVDGLYCEALVLSDEVRAVFAPRTALSGARHDEDLVRIALSCEGLRATTRMMHAIAWLLNHRAYFMGELPEFQLRRTGRLSPELQGPVDADNLALLGNDARALVAVTERFYARLLRLDESWRQARREGPSAIAALRERLAHKVARQG